MNLTVVDKMSARRQGAVLTARNIYPAGAGRLDFTVIKAAVFTSHNKFRCLSAAKYMLLNVKAGLFAAE